MVIWFAFETNSHYTALAGLELGAVHWLHLPKYLDSSYMLPHLPFYALSLPLVYKEDINP